MLEDVFVGLRAFSYRLSEAWSSWWWALVRSAGSSCKPICVPLTRNTALDQLHGAILDVHAGCFWWFTVASLPTSYIWLYSSRIFLEQATMNALLSSFQSLSSSPFVFFGFHWTLCLQGRYHAINFWDINVVHGMDTNHHFVCMWRAWCNLDHNSSSTVYFPVVSPTATHTLAASNRTSCSAAY